MGPTRKIEVWVRAGGMIEELRLRVAAMDHECPDKGIRDIN